MSPRTPYVQPSRGAGALPSGGCDSADRRPQSRAITTHLMAGSDSSSTTPIRKGERYHHPDLREAMIRVAQELLESEGPSGWTVRIWGRHARLCDQRRTARLARPCWSDKCCEN